VARARLIVTRSKGKEHAAETAFTDDNDVIRALSAKRANQSFAYAFCQGEPGLIGRSRIPITPTRAVTTCPSALSLSRIRYLSAVA